MIMPDVPPRYVLDAARRELNRTGNYAAYYDVLCGYYGVQKLPSFFDAEKCSKTAIATYYRVNGKGTVYSKTASMTEHTALHEFYHHLEYEFNPDMSSEVMEALADAFANACLNNLSSGSRSDVNPVFSKIKALESGHELLQARVEHAFDHIFPNWRQEDLASFLSVVDSAKLSSIIDQCKRQILASMRREKHAWREAALWNDAKIPYNALQKTREEAFRQLEQECLIKRGHGWVRLLQLEPDVLREGRQS